MSEADNPVITTGDEVLSGSVDEKKGVITKKESKANADKSGLMQRLLGSGNEAKYGISAIVVIGLFIVGLIFTVVVCLDNWFFCCDSSMMEDIKTIWGIVTPLLTLTLGYVFGKGR